VDGTQLQVDEMNENGQDQLEKGKHQTADEQDILGGKSPLRQHISDISDGFSSRQTWQQRAPTFPEKIDYFGGSGFLRRRRTIIEAESLSHKKQTSFLINWCKAP
jgi:hypothetical protein